jgi:hypothetical protein
MDPLLTLLIPNSHIYILINYFIPTNALHCFSVFCPYICFGTTCAFIRGVVEISQSSMHPVHFHNIQFCGGPLAWPTRLLDLIPLDYYLWGHMNALVYETRVGWRAAQYHHIFAVAEHIHNHSVNIVSATQALWMHAEKCRASRGGHFEQLLWSRYFGTGK